MSKHSPLLFNFSSMSNAKSTASKKFINQHQNENQPPHNYSKRKRNFAELENSNFQLSDRGSSNIRLSIPKVSSIHTEKSIKPITNKFKTVSNNSAEKTEDDASEAINQLDKFLYLDEKFSDNDKFSLKNPSLSNLLFKIDFTQNNRLDYFCTLKRSPYPEIIISKYKESINENKEISILSGLYEELNIVYVTFDNEIYLWNYITDEVINFKEIGNLITCLYITKPKLNVFSEEISHIIIVTTENEIFILLIKQIDKTKIQIILSDYILDLKTQYIVTCIVSTYQRRIFLGSQNDYIFELEYYNSNSSSIFRTAKKMNTIERSKEGLLNKLIPQFLYNLKSLSYYVKIVVDDTRNILYALKHYLNDGTTLYEFSNVMSSEIEIYDLGIYGDNFIRKGVLKQNEIKNNYFYSSHFKNNKNYIIVDISPLTRIDSKNNNLIAITYSGLRAFIKLDFLDKETLKITDDLQHFFNASSLRPSNTFSILIAPIADHSKSMKQDKEKSEGMNVNDLTELIQYKNFFIFGRNLFSFIKIIENDESIYLKNILDSEKSNFDNTLVFNENVTNLFKFKKDRINISSIKRLSFKDSDKNILRLLRFNNEENKYSSKFYTFINKIYLRDSNCHFSNICMHLYSNQQFLHIEQYLILTTSEIITIGKIRPIDLLYEILKDRESESDDLTFLNKFILDHSLYETTYMLLVIICNKNFKFYERKLSIDENGTDHLLEIYNNKDIISKANSIYFRLIAYKSNLKIFKDDNNSYSNIIGQAISEKTMIINHISYSLCMYLSRVSRLFWEENIFNGNPKVFIDEPLKIEDFTFLISTIIEFSEKIKEMKNEILIKTNDYYNIQNETDIKTTSEFMSFQKDIEQVLIMANRLIEVLKFVQIIYNLSNIKKHINNFEQEIVDVLMSIKFKDIIKNPKDIFIRQLVEEYLELVNSNRDTTYLRIKLNEFIDNCPSIISKSDGEAIISSILIKIAQKVEDEIQRKNTLNQAIDLIRTYPESIRLEKISKTLAEMNEIALIIKISCEKAIYLRKNLEKDNIVYDNISNLSMGISQYSKGKTSIYTEFKQCLFYIFKILTEIHYSIKNSELPNEGESLEIIKNYLDKRKLSLTEKNSLLNQCITEILQYDDEFLHNMLFDHLTSLNMVENISNFNSPYIENYLNNQIEIDKSDPKKHESLFKYFYKANDYENAFKKLLSLINFNNVNSKENYVNLIDRKNYCLLALNCLENLLKCSDEHKRNEYIKLKNSLTDYKLILLVQISIYDQLLALYNKESTALKRETYERELFQLDTQKFSIDELYIISKNNELFDMVIDLLFLMSKSHEKSFSSITKEEIAFIYESYFKKIIHSNGNFPKCLFPILNMIIAKRSETNMKTFEKLFPLNELTEIIEHLNFEFFEFSRMEVNYSFKMFQDLTFETEGITFWFVLYLFNKVNLSYSKIFHLYNDYYEKTFVNINERIKIHFISILLYIIILWSLLVEKLKNESRLDINSKEAVKNETEYENFVKEQNILRSFTEKVKKESNSLNIKTIIEQNIYEKILSLIKLGQDKFISLVEKINLEDNKIKFDFNFKDNKTDPFLKENFVKRESACSNEMFTLGNIFDHSQSFKSLIHKTSNSQNPMSRRNILEEEEE